MSNANAKSHLEDAAGHLKAARVTHAEVRAGHEVMSDLATRARTAMAEGKHDKAGKLLDRLSDAASTARDNHASTADHHRALGHSLDAAARSIEPDAGAYQEPTHSAPQGPSQTSAGQGQGTSGPPRSFDPEAIRLRDQRAGIDLCYAERQRQLRGLR
ncbi:MAG: hypothetical protein ACLPV2_09875 [Steroidobacteraceae bacterium]